MSDDGRHALTLIAFVGSVFSPYYARARRRGAADPRDHVAINLALYGAGPHRWTMTERGRQDLQRSPQSLHIGPSQLRWEDGALVATLDEVAVPWPRRVRGTLRLDPGPVQPRAWALDPDGRHHWQPVAPRARVVLALESPRLQWSGGGYLDANWGDAPLEEAFSRWDWSRTACPDGRCLLRYAVTLRGGGERRLDLQVGPQGDVTDVDPAPATRLVRTRWGLDRHFAGPAGTAMLVEDGPFYARTLLCAPGEGPVARSVHEHLSLDRFRQRWVQALLPFRMPRRSRG